MNTVNLKDEIKARKPQLLRSNFDAHVDGEGDVYVTAVLERTVVFEMSSGLPTLSGEVRSVAAFQRVTADPAVLCWVTPKYVVRFQDKYLVQAAAHYNREDSRRRGQKQAAS